MLNLRPILRTILFALLLPVFCAAHVSLAYGQDFSLTASPLNPPAVTSGQNATSILDLTASGGFDSSVSLTCTVTSEGTIVTSPSCVVSPASAIPNAMPALTVYTTGAPTGQYTVNVTATNGSLPPQSVILLLNVQEVPGDYTLTVSKAISPTSVEAGLGAQATITITPIGDYDQASPPNQVTLSCLSISPTITAAPYCSFASSSGAPYVQVTSSGPATAVLTITSFGPAATTTASAKPWKLRMFYGFWLAVPGLVLAGAGARGSRWKKLLGLLLLMVVASGLLLMPACNSTTNNGNTAPNGDVTPDGTYTFTITGVDQTGASPSNNGTSNAAATVSLTVVKAP